MVLNGILIGVGLYLLLLARSAWKQGELKQFLRSLVVVIILVAGIAGIVAAWIWFDRNR